MQKNSSDWCSHRVDDPVPERSRRAHPRHLGGCVRAALLAGCVFPLTLAASPKADLTGSWQLFIDDHLIGAKENVVRTYHPFVKHPDNPVLKADQPWENKVVNCDAVLPTEDGSGYRMWYYCWSTRKDPDRSHELYATSADGIHWTKPKLGLLPWKVTGSSDNNLVGAGDSLMFTPFDPDPARRYKAVRYEGESAAKYFLYSSPDGLRWQRLSPNAIFDAGDTSHVMWDPFTSRYRGYAKVNVWVNGLRRRGIGFSEETRFESWPALRLVMAPDDFDDRWVEPGSVQRTHFYRCSVFAYQNMYIGLLSIYRAEDDEGYFHGPIFIELVTSRDGVHWRRQDGDRPPILATGPKRSWDHGMLDVGSSLLRVGDELRVYYSGYDGLHDYLPFHSAVRMATLRPDGFASIDGDDNPGYVVTKPLLGLKGKLRLNCEAAKGLVQVEVLDANDRVLPGYRRREFNEPRGDGIDQAVSWHEHDELPAHPGPLKLRFWLKNASLYSFHAGDAVRVAERPAPAALAALFTFEKANGKVVANALASAARHELRFLGTSKIDREPKNAGRGTQSVTVASPWRPLNALQISGTTELGRTFTLAMLARSTEREHARLFSAYNGNRPVTGSELVFDYDPSGRVLSGLRLVAHGIPLLSNPIAVEPDKYHHVAVTYDEGHVRFYFDGEPAGEGWLPGGAPITLARDLLVGEDAELGSDEQFNGNVDDILVLGRVLAAAEMKAVAAQGADAFLADGARAAVPAGRKK